MFTALVAHWELPASAIRELFQAWRAAGTDLALERAVCSRAGEKELDTYSSEVQLSSAYLTFTEHSWCFKDIQYFESLLNADLYELSNNFYFTCMAGMGIHPSYSQIL